MIGVIVQQTEGSIQLFCQHYPHQAMRQSHGRQRQQLLRSAFNGLVQPVRTANDEGHIITTTHPGLHLL